MRETEMRETALDERVEIEELFLARRLHYEDCAAFKAGRPVSEFPSVQHARKELAVATELLHQWCGKEVDGLGQDFSRVAIGDLPRNSTTLPIGWRVDLLQWVSLDWYYRYYPLGVCMGFWDDDHMNYDCLPEWANPGHFKDARPIDILKLLILNQDRAQELADGIAVSNPSLMTPLCRYFIAADAEIDLEKLRSLDLSEKWQLQGLDALLSLRGEYLFDLWRYYSPIVVRRGRFVEDIIGNAIFDPNKIRQIIWHLLAASVGPRSLLKDIWSAFQGKEWKGVVQENLKLSFDLFAAAKEEDLYSILNS